MNDNTGLPERLLLQGQSTPIGAVTVGHFRSDTRANTIE
jgi:hypothetical protein